MGRENDFFFDPNNKRSGISLLEILFLKDSRKFDING